MADQCKEEIKTALENSDLPVAAEKAKEYLDELDKVPLAIAITGESGSGKSTLVNALRGIKNNTEGAAPTGAVETTMEPTEYIHPQNEKFRIWDLPGIGTTNFTAAKYLKHVGFEKYDFFIIVSSDRFRENDAKLAKEIKKKKKKFYFVRSKIDHNIRDEKDKPNFSEKNLLKLIRDNCTKELQKLGIQSPKIFLVSGLRLNLYEFNDMWKTLEEELPEHQSDALLLALPSISLDVIKQKKNVLESQITWYAAGSAAGAAVLVPGLSAGVDLALILDYTVNCQKSLGLSSESLLKLSEVSGVPLEDLRAQLKSPLAGVKVTGDLVRRVLTTSAAYVAAVAIEEVVRFAPFIGTVFAMALSSATTYKALNYILNTLCEDAQRVFIKALGLNTSV